MRVRRIGSVTLGLGLLVFGLLFLLHTLWDGISYGLIFRFWPCLLVSLGLEVLWSLRKQEDGWVYDKGAVVMMVLISFFAMSMATAQMFFEWTVQTGRICW